MKTFSKPAIGVISALLLIIGIMSYIIISKNNTSYAPRQTTTQIKTDTSTHPISFCDAVNAKKHYANIWAHHLITDGKSGLVLDPLTGSPLKGWRLRLNGIEPLLKLWYEGKLDELFLVPIMRPNTRQGSTRISALYVSILIAGIYKNEILFDSTNSMFFEYLRPCPDNCPKNYDSIFVAEQNCPPVIIGD